MLIVSYIDDSGPDRTDAYAREAFSHIFSQWDVETTLRLIYKELPTYLLNKLIT